VSVFRPSARATGPDGREWEIYAYTIKLPARSARKRIRPLVRLADFPVAALRALRSDEWTVEAISWAPFRASYRWTTTREYRGQVLAQVEGGLARGEKPQPRNAVLLEQV
jgi:hypothetical protein